MKRSDLIFILVASIILGIIWSIFTLLHTLNTSTISDSVNIQIAPLPGVFNTQTITTLKKGVHITPAYVLTPAVSPTAIPTPTPTPPLITIITATPSATPIFSNGSASTGGALQ